MSILALERVFVGVDYHQNGVQVSVMNADGLELLNRRVANDAGLVAKLGQSVTAAIECCCGAANFAKELRDRGWNISLAHAGFVARMKQNPDKTDLGDARLLADLVRVGYLPKVWLAPDAIIDLRRLVRFRQQALAAGLSRRGKPKTVIIVAIANRWMRWLYHQLQPTNVSA